MNSKGFLELSKRVRNKGSWNASLGEDRHAFQGERAQDLIHFI
jgi:hypothetical protein